MNDLFVRDSEFVWARPSRLLSEICDKYIPVRPYLIIKEGFYTMNIYEELNVQPIINAAGTYTLLGGSKMSEQTLKDMVSASGNFVQIRELQNKVYGEIAMLTKK